MELPRVKGFHPVAEAPYEGHRLSECSFRLLVHRPHAEAQLSRSTPRLRHNLRNIC